MSPEEQAGIERILRDPGSDPELADAGLAHLDGAPNPLGAAVVASISVDRSVGGVAWPFADAWAAAHGLPFAACAYAEFGSAAVESSPVTGKARIVAASRYGRHTRAWLRDDHGASLFRNRMAAADDEIYAEAVERLADCRRDPAQRAVVSFLVPDRRDWVDECCAAPPEDPYRWMLLLGLTTADQLAALGDWMPQRWWEYSTGVVPTMVSGLGGAMAPLLIDTLERDLSVPETRTMINALALLPSDEAFQALVDRVGRKYVQPALLGAMKRFPVRAVRLLAPATRGSTQAAGLVRDLLAAHLAAAPGRAEAVLPDMPPGVRAVIESLAASSTRVPDAPADTLPPELVTPPWTQRRAPLKPTVIAGLIPPTRQAMTWADGERERWTVDDSNSYTRRYERREHAIQAIETQQTGRGHGYEPALFIWGPEDLVLPLLGDWRPSDLAGARSEMAGVVARFELDALPVALYAARSRPSGVGGVLLPYLDAEVALLTAGWLARQTSARRVAVEWFGRHGADAVPYLVPAALGELGQQRTDAEGALRHVASVHGSDAVVAAAREFGDEAGRAVEQLVAVDPAELFLDRIPTIGKWAGPDLLPQVLLRDRKQALPREAVAHLLTMLAISEPRRMYPGIEEVREACDPACLAEFSWAVFRSWQADGSPARDGWALAQLGWLGDDETVRRLAPLIRAWPGEGRNARAVQGLDVLGEIGTDVALMHLNGIAQKIRFPALKARAKERIEDVAARLGLTPERLADRLVPDFGLDRDGTLVLDYGPRRFVAGFDEQLSPFVTDEQGRRRKTLPKPGAKDDSERAEEAYRRFVGLRKDVRMVADELVRRLEKAMVTRRTWTLAEFQDLFVARPLTRHITGRLVWTAEDGDRTTAFRIAEDRSPADVTDAAADLSEAAAIRIAHPVDLGGDLSAWSDLFADYEILQPFPQLGRTVFTLTDDECSTGRLERFEDRMMPVRGVLRLIRRGWERGGQDPADDVTRWAGRQLAPGCHLVVGLDPGVAPGTGIDDPDQKILHARLDDRVGDRPGESSGSHRDVVSFDALDPAIVSEALSDLTDAFEVDPG